MDRLTFFASLVSALAWPIVAIVLVFALRRPLFSLLHNIDRLKYGALDISLSGELADAERRLDAVQSFRSMPLPGSSPETMEVSETVNRLAAISPQAAIVEAWARLEETIRARAREAGASDRTTGRKEEPTTEEIAVIIDQLQRLRNRIVHDQKAAVTAKEAIHYGYLTERLMGLLTE